MILKAIVIVVAVCISFYVLLPLNGSLNKFNSLTCAHVVSNKNFILSSSKRNRHQESPTKELAENGFPLATEGHPSQSKSPERISASDDSSDGNISEESESKILFKHSVKKKVKGVINLLVLSTEDQV